MSPIFAVSGTKITKSGDRPNAIGPDWSTTARPPAMNGYLATAVCTQTLRGLHTACLLVIRTDQTRPAILFCAADPCRAAARLGAFLLHGFTPLQTLHRRRFVHSSQAGTTHVCCSDRTHYKRVTTAVKHPQTTPAKHRLTWIAGSGVWDSPRLCPAPRLRHPPARRVGVGGGEGSGWWSFTLIVGADGAGTVPGPTRRERRTDTEIAAADWASRNGPPRPQADGGFTGQGKNVWDGLRVATRWSTIALLEI